MSAKLERLSQNLQKHLGDRIAGLQTALGEITLDVDAAAYPETMLTLRDAPELRFEELTDLCGLDYSVYGDGQWQGKRFCVVSHLLSVTHNWRLRVRCFAPGDDSPAVPSVVSVWNSANWYEREAFDLFGIVFTGHADLRRLLCDYDFDGHPFRKDFPISGHLEMRYDPKQKRVVYQPVSIEPREMTPRIVREENYGKVGQ
jgi:NADH-quinone oxidoreductase subunit C